MCSRIKNSSCFLSDDDGSNNEALGELGKNYVMSPQTSVIIASRENLLLVHAICHVCSRYHIFQRFFQV